MEGGQKMTREEFQRIGGLIADEMAKVDADMMDYYRIAKLVSSLTMLKLMSMGADDDDVMECLNQFTESLRIDLRGAWPEIKSKCIITPN